MNKAHKNFKIIQYGICLLLFGGCYLLAAAQPAGGGKRNLPTAVDRQFKRDAARLALRLAAEKEDARYLNTEIDKEQSTSLYKALTNLYINEIFDPTIVKCNIHTLPNPSIDHLTIIYEQDANWATPLRQGISETTSKEINSIFDRYELAIEKLSDWDNNLGAILIRSKEPLNMAAIAGSLEDIRGIKQVDLGAARYTSGNDIKVRPLSDGWEIEFILQFPDLNNPKAPKQHSWKYKANEKEEFTLLKESGEDVPTFMKAQ